MSTRETEDSSGGDEVTTAPRHLHTGGMGDKSRIPLPLERTRERVCTNKVLTMD